ncbi:MAG: hypothetical protein ACYCW6_10835 [Candidatus Xenobia bacterium]
MPNFVPAAPQAVRMEFPTPEALTALEETEIAVVPILESGLTIQGMVRRQSGWDITVAG